MGNDLSEIEALGEVAVDRAQQFVDGPAAVVPGDVGMQVQPQALDLVLVRAVGR